MRRSIFPLLLLMLFGCAGQKELPVEYPAALKAEARPAFVEQFRKGQVLYEMNCGGCHNLVVNGKTIIPDFSVPQLLDYEMRFQYASHEDRLREVDVSVQELDDIQIYLQYRERSGVPVAPLPVLPQVKSE